VDLAQVKQMIDPQMLRVEETIQETLFAETKALKSLIEHVSLFGGKRLRPALVLVVSKALDRTTEDHIKLGAVIELIHTASLIHDDILDEATMRRRVASVNHLHGNHVPVLLGDLIYARAFGLSLTLSTPLASKRLADVTQTICSGEIEQIFHRGAFDLEEATYFAIIEAKTASLYAAACSLAAEYAGAPDETVRALDRYGLSLGTAFQIVDDCLDIIGDEDVVGKSLGTDADMGKMTLPLLHLSASLPKSGKSRLREIFLSTELKDKQAAITAEFDLQPSVDHAFKVADQYINNALKALEALPESLFREALSTVGDFVLNRKL
jgi:octaprenyl-diphosphate synthase